MTVNDIVFSRGAVDSESGQNHCLPVLDILESLYANSNLLPNGLHQIVGLYYFSYQNLSCSIVLDVLVGNVNVVESLKDAVIIFINFSHHFRYTPPL